MGLADGRVLFETLHDRVHPIGALRNDVKYTDVYVVPHRLCALTCTRSATFPRLRLGS